MIAKVRTAAAVSLGRFTPFLAADWGPEEREIAGRWLEGQAFPSAPHALRARLERDLGGFVTPLNLGRAGIQLALEAMGLPSGSGVILPSYACAGVVLPVLQTGLRPVLCDVGDDLNPTLETIRAAYRPGVRAVIVPHLAGVWVADLDRILDWARSESVRIIEDAAHAHGLAVDGRQSGTLGDAAIFSTGLGKPLFGPGGGWLRTADEALTERVNARVLDREPEALVRQRLKSFADGFSASPTQRGRRLIGAVVSNRRRRSQATPSPNGHAPAGFIVAEMPDVEAALVGSMLAKLPDLVSARRRHAQLWRAALGDLESETFRMAPERDNSCLKLWLSFRGPTGEARATEARKRLWAHRVETESLYLPLHRRAFAASAMKAGLPTTETLWRGVFSVPVRASLRDSDRERICEAAAALAAFVRRTS